MQRVFAKTGAVFFQLQPLRILFFILRGCVIDHSRFRTLQMYFFPHFKITYFDLQAPDRT